MNVLTYVAHVREKPHHLRKQVAFAVAAGITALIAIAWLSINLATGSFAISGSSFADAGKAKIETAPGPTNTSLLGAVGAAFTGKTEPAHIEVVEPGTSVEVKTQKAPEPTVLPF